MLREELNWEIHPKGSEICQGRYFAPQGSRDCSTAPSSKTVASILIITIKNKILCADHQRFLNQGGCPPHPAWERRGGDRQSCWRSGRVLRGVEQHKYCQRRMKEPLKASLSSKQCKRWDNRKKKGTKVERYWSKYPQKIKLY